MEQRNQQRNRTCPLAEQVNASEADWLVERINHDGELHDAEKALLLFIKRESPDIHPGLKPCWTGLPDLRIPDADWPQLAILFADTASVHLTWAAHIGVLSALKGDGSRFDCRGQLTCNH
jgi:hypothetical protein